MTTFNITASDYDTLITNLLQNTRKNSRQIYLYLNAETTNTALKDRGFLAILNLPEACVALDGMGSVYAARLKGFRIPERIPFTDMIIKILSHPKYKQNKPGIFFLGSKPGNASLAQQHLKKKFPNANFVGHHHGYFKKENQIVQMINQSGARILFVGLGCPAQEKWISRNREKLKVPVLISCGGKFDYYANGRIKRAPVWMQRIGLEWLFRLILEPQRLWRRYTLGLLKFLMNFPRYTFQLKGQNQNDPA